MLTKITNLPADHPYLQGELNDMAEQLEFADTAENRKALWAKLQFSLDGEPDPWFEFDKASVDTRQFNPISV